MCVFLNVAYNKMAVINFEMLNVDYFFNKVHFSFYIKKYKLIDKYENLNKQKIY